MATLQGKAVKNTYRQVLQIGANNVGVSGTLQPVQDGTGTNTALSLSTAAATINGTLTITGDLIITGGGIQIQDLIDDTVASLIQNGTGITWAYNDTLRTLTPTITIATADGGVQGDFMQFNVNAGEASAVGKLKWNTTDGTLDLGLMGGQVTLQIGQEQVARVVNNSGTILTEAGYQVVKIASAQGQRLAVNLAQANNDANSVDTLGLVTENIANNQEGYITTSGLVREIDTTGDLQLEDWNDGDVLYLSPTTPGAITKVKPIAPNHTIIVGYVIYAHKNNGQIFVKVDNGYELDELHNVRITAVANNNVLRYNSSLAVWENVAPLTTWITEGTNLYYTQGRFDSAFAAKSTTNLAEGTNLYFTTARGNANFATNLAASTTTNLAEGTNLYFTNQRFDSRFGTKTTTDLAEGTNLYYTQARFNTAFDAKTTTDLDEGTNLYYTDARARAAISENAVGLDYSSGSGVLSLTAGYAIPTTVKLGDYDTAYNRSIVSAAVTGTGTKTLSLTQQDANLITATWTDQGITTINGTANQIAATTVGNTTTLAFTNDVTMPNNLVVSGNLTINGTATYVNTQAISAKDPLFEVANDNNTTDAVDIGYYGRYFDSAQTRVEFTGLFRDASDAGKFKFFTGLTVEPTNVVDTTGTGYTVGTLVANVEGNLAGTANAANVLSTARSISATGDAAWTVNFDGSANATGALTLANTGVTATTYGTSTSVPTIAVDGKGRITNASNTAINFPVTTVNSLSGNVVLTTSNVAEGTNQYFTSARAQASITGGASSVVTADLTASRALVSDGTGKIAASASTTATEIGYVAGVTSAIQTQLNGKQATLTNPVTGTGTTNYLPKFTGASTIGDSLISATSAIITIQSAAANYAQLQLNGAAGYGSQLKLGEATGGYGAAIMYNVNVGTGIEFYSGGVGSGSLVGYWSNTGLAIGSSSNGGYKLQVTGTTNLIGALSGTSATFTSGLINGTTDAFFDINRSASGNAGRVRFQTAGTDEFEIGLKGGVAGFHITKGDATELLTIASTGAATFSSTITAATLSTIGTAVAGQNVQLNLNGVSGKAQRIEFQNSGVQQWLLGAGAASETNAFELFNSTGVISLSINKSTNAATFSSSVTATGGFEIPNGQFYRARRSSGSLLTDMIGIPSATDDVRILTTGAFKVVSGGLTTFLNISDTGAATFSSSVRTTSLTTATNSGSSVNITTNGQSGDSGTPLVTELTFKGFNGNNNGRILVNDVSNSAQVGNMQFFTYNGGQVSCMTLTQQGNAYFNSLGTGTVYSNGGVLTNTNPSDERLKENIQNLNWGLKEILQLRPVEYTWKNDKTNQGKQYGFIAQEVKPIIPELVKEFTISANEELGTEEAVLLGLEKEGIWSTLVKAIQEQQAQIEELKALIAAK